MSQIASIALGGLQRASQAVSESAERISNSENLGDANDVVSLKQGEIAFKANAKVIEVAKELDDTILDILA